MDLSILKWIYLVASSSIGCRQTLLLCRQQDVRIDRIIGQVGAARNLESKLRTVLKMSAQLSKAVTKKQQAPVAVQVSRDLPRLQLKNRGPNDPSYGLDYDEESALLMMRAEATIARNKLETPEEGIRKFRQEILRIDQGIDSSDESEPEAEFVCTPFASPQQFTMPLTQVGECETFYLSTEKSQPHLIAMCQGLIARCDDPYMTTYLFDLERDELLKNCPQKAQLLPQVKILKEEAGRRSSVFKIKPLKKSATKTELIEWLKQNPITDSMDEAFLYFEGNKTYRMLMKQAEEAATAESERLSTANWNSPYPWMRLYHCSLDDDVLELLKTSSECLTRPELDARNSAERPKLYWQRIADKYNSDKVYVSHSLPELHSMFAERIDLKFEDMPGGSMSADDVKWRLGEARAKMISVSIKLLE
jgi:hypothetical protein